MGSFFSVISVTEYNTLHYSEVNDITVQYERVQYITV